AKLQQAGFGDLVKSWIGNGQNLPITADQLRQVLGSDTVRQIAAKYNVPIDQVTEVLAHELPLAADKASPDGKLPHRAWGCGRAGSWPGRGGAQEAQTSRLPP